MMDFLHDSSFAQSVSRFAVVFIPAYLGIILHEVGHGWAALREGDPTAKFMGRLTINPLPHIDVLGFHHHEHQRRLRVRLGQARPH